MAPAKKANSKSVAVGTSVPPTGDGTSVQLTSTNDETTQNGVTGQTNTDEGFRLQLVEQKKRALQQLDVILDISEEEIQELDSINNALQEKRRRL